MGHLAARKRLPLVILMSGVVTVLAGLLLYWRASGGLDADWITSGPGLGFTIGGLAAIVTLALGLSITKPAVDRIGALGQEIATGGGQPTPEQGAEMQRLQARTVAVGRVSMMLLTIAVVAMAGARYL